MSKRGDQLTASGPGCTSDDDDDDDDDVIREATTVERIWQPDSLAYK